MTRRFASPSTARRVRWFVFWCSLIFTVGTLLHGWVVIDTETMERTMVLAGSSPAEAAADAPGFLRGFRVVGAVFVLGNAIGMLAPRGRAWTLWVVLVVNAAQATGPLGMIPLEMFQAAGDVHGWWGVLPSLVTDGGAMVLTVVLLAFLIRYRRGDPRQAADRGGCDPVSPSASKAA